MSNKKICPFKKTVVRKFRCGVLSYSERFAGCAGEKCMAFKEGRCLRLESKGGGEWETETDKRSGNGAKNG